MDISKGVWSRISRERTFQWDVLAVLKTQQSGKGRAGGKEAKLGLGSHPGGSQP